VHELQNINYPIRCIAQTQLSDLLHPSKHSPPQTRC